MIEKTNAIVCAMALANFGFYAISGDGLWLAAVLAAVALILTAIGIAKSIALLDETAQDLVRAKSEMAEPRDIKIEVF